MSARRPTRLPRWHEWSIYLGFGILLLTGLAWLAFDKWVRISGEFGPEHHPGQHLLIIIHGIVAYAFLIVVGALIPVHVKVGWSTARNKVSGLTTASLLGFVALTALGLYYAGGDTAREWSSLAHWIVGIVVAPALLIHVLRGLRGATPRRAGSPRPRGRPKPAG